MNNQTIPKFVYEKHLQENSCNIYYRNPGNSNAPGDTGYSQ